MNQEHIQKLIDSLEQRVSKFENKSPVSQSLLDDDYNRIQISGSISESLC